MYRDLGFRIQQLRVQDLKGLWLEGLEFKPTCSGHEAWGFSVEGLGA